MTRYPAFGPIHRLGLGILRPWFAGVVVGGGPVHVGSLIPENMSSKLPFIMVRSDRRSGLAIRASDDERFMKSSRLSIETFTSGLNAENDGYDIQESVRLALWDAWSKQTTVPDAGSISTILSASEAARVTDYATSTGVVQYASLPKGAVRTEAIYEVFVRPPEQSSIKNPFIPDIITP